MQLSFAQEKTVKGVVTDASGAMPGVNVVVKGTQRGVSTGFDGSYSIKASQGEVLVFSFMGMNDVFRTVDASGVFNVKMQDDAKQLETVVVTAVGIKKRPDAITSSSQVVGSKELTQASNPDVVRSLAARVSGLQINGTSNGVDGGNSIRIRSMLSLTGNTEALVVIDNVISNATTLASLPSSVVTSVTVLKGAQGAALYGSQGKQGVILVQTKKGSKSESLTVAFNSSADIEEINFVPERQQRYGQGWYNSYDPQENGGWGPLFDGEIRQVGLPLEDGSIIEAPYSALGNDNIKKFYTTGQIFQNSINVNAGGETGYFNLNMSNLRRSFILEGDNFNRNNVVLTAGKNYKKLTLGGTFTFTNQKTKQADVNAATSRGDYTLLTNLLQTASNIPIELFKDRGLYGWNGYYQNPYWAKDNNRLNSTNNFINLGLSAAYDFTKNISLSYAGSVQMRNVNQISYANEGITPSIADADFSNAASFFQSNFGSTFYYGDLIANLNYELTDKIGMKINLGQNMQYNYSKRFSQGGSNFEIPGFYNITNVLNPAIPTTLNNNTFVNTSVATFINADFNYSDYLFLNATSRYEGSSVAPKGDQFYFYPSVGLSFVPTKAFSGLKDKSTVSNIKVYGNYSKVGSFDPVLPYEFSNQGAIATNFPFPNTGASYNDLISITDFAIKPEMYTTLEAGINLGFFNNRLTLDVAAFKTGVKDLISNVSVGSATGLFNKKGNIGELEGKGLEVDLGFTAFNTPSFKWNGRMSYSSSDTKVISVDNNGKDDNSVIIFNGGNSGIDANISAVEGHSYPYITGTDWTRDASGNIIVNAQGRPTPTSTFQNLGRVTPKYILGLSNNFEYKGIGLGFVLDYRTGHNFISKTKNNLTWNGHLVDSAEFDRDLGFLIPNSVIDNPATATVGDYIPNTDVLTGGFYSLTGNANRTQAYYGLASNLGSHNMVDATALKVREIVLSYSLPKKALGNSGIESFKVSFNARNPFVIFAKDNRGYADPEASGQVNNNNSNAARTANGTLTNTSRNGLGFIGDAQYPSTRTFGLSVNATF